MDKLTEKIKQNWHIIFVIIFSLILVFFFSKYVATREVNHMEEKLRHEFVSSKEYQEIQDNISKLKMDMMLAEERYKNRKYTIIKQYKNERETYETIKEDKQKVAAYFDCIVFSNKSFVNDNGWR